MHDIDRDRSKLPKWTQVLMHDIDRDRSKLPKWTQVLLQEFERELRRLNDVVQTTRGEATTTNIVARDGMIDIPLPPHCWIDMDGVSFRLDRGSQGQLYHVMGTHGALAILPISTNYFRIQKVNP